jgi:organic hydroperoxide reductase OsmC/OhrA
MSTITLCPQIDFIGEKQPTADDIKHLHEEAHKQCFIGNSLLTEIIIEPK